MAEPHPINRQRIRKIVTLAMFGLILAYFIFSFVPVLARWRSVGFGFLGVAIALWVFDRAILKRPQ